MALTVEDGSIVAGADSYVSLAYAATYFANRQTVSGGVVTDPWDEVDDDIKEASLRYATQWIDKRFDWVGYMTDPDDQPLSWPRYNAWDDWRQTTLDSDFVPDRIKDAVCEMALQHVTEALNEVLARGGEVASITVGPISESYFEGAPSERDFPFVEDLLKGLHHNSDGGLMVPLVRA